VTSSLAAVQASRPIEQGANAFLQFFRCPSHLVEVETNRALNEEQGYFTFGGAVCYGQPAGIRPASLAVGPLPDVTHNVIAPEGEPIVLPFDFSDVVRNLREERYRRSSAYALEAVTAAQASRDLYYCLRPMLPVAVRKHLQRVRLAGWKRIGFPRWPVDVSVETLMEHLMTLVLKFSGQRRTPFIWFWPNGAPGCIMMTHDVESASGYRFCDQLMDFDESFGIKSAFQLVPELPVAAADGLWDGIRRRGFEANLHDLNHDGGLFCNRSQFLQRAARINEYARTHRCRGFRSGAMYREQSWFDAFEFSYDMSVPNVAHLEPQRGGCCTVMPYFVGRILELPLTTTQDYSLFHIIGDYSIDLWKRQIELILAKSGLVSFVAHPDYLHELRAQAVYRKLLEHLAQLRADQGTWVALPGEVDRWWRNRDAMSLVRVGSSWKIQGPGSEHARLAWACLDEDDRLVYTLGQGEGPR
jgi:hypothetical protein